ncbi:uncharacterized protein Z520_09440 [Fonsecaea multimorphosa CBS 102226]|uniref:Nudix hydrolase domain-containing protein n=1 Tax=Fonsecaea multimorphosa CBS 102226 TaxID=1442371 RepID=A0A0D2GYY0_9EURO|nr:uncharacterized protein Z520_09440 [Fonsecaea multimorphosa CBS 102226]KIX94750.1 hypothetical protein Z520_09440 [Fonsecaea multimorphosa CBS 102226]
MAADSASACSDFTFTSHPSVSPFTVPYQRYITDGAARAGSLDYQYVAVGALVFSRSPSSTATAATAESTPTDADELRVLLVQRAAHDSAPLRWEIPGGACDLDDPSILHSVARELWEETGLIAKSIGPLVGQGRFFVTRSVEVEGGGNPAGTPQVRLDPNEHANYVWATEEECRDRRTKGASLELIFTTSQQQATLLEGFEIRKEFDRTKIMP